MADATWLRQRRPRDPSVQNLLRRCEAAEQAAERKDYYAILEVPKTANDAELKKAFRKMALKYHPDKCVSLEGAEKDAALQRFKDVNEAYEVLSDPRKRQMFDSGADMRGGRMPGGGGMPGVPIDISQIFSMFGGMGGMGGFPGMGGGNVRMSFGGPPPGFGGPRSAPRGSRPQGGAGLPPEFFSMFG
eukprot:gnl/Ergobibamus_cyprinoides/84.p2 GENE.gnl/Ergobibamus_cyprinoides/84~~gnl/Ergobibamus_cyprinoides/84.p2  ORF type:complete len:188 (+),score=43.92 gnl/Ergobibamus_cyprinoides/84:559-1122(+)